MEVIFLTLAYPIDVNYKNIYSDFFDEISSKGHNITVFCPDETRTFGKIIELFRKSVRIVHIPTGKITKTSIINKIINTILLEYRYLNAIKKYLKIKPDIVVYSTPPITFVNVVKLLKKNTNCFTYLFLKDIFPQNAVDLNLLKKNSLIYKHFRKNEKALYKISDYIGCLSPANVKYILNNNPEIDYNKVHENPNSICPTKINKLPIIDTSILDYYQIPKDKFRLVYGGNLGKPQGVEYILKFISELQLYNDIHFTIIGDGTEYGSIKEYIKKNNYKNTSLIKYLPLNDYKILLACMDVGMVFLDFRFTTPNFPSRILDYLDQGLPIITATDIATDIGSIIENHGAGLSCISKDTENLFKCINKLKDSKEFRKSASNASRRLLEEKYSVKISADIFFRYVNNSSISKHF